jgi:hypothetical protein
MPRMSGRVGKESWPGDLTGDLGNEGLKERGEVSLGAETHLHDLFVVDGLVDHSGGEVGDEGEAEDVEAHVTGDGDLVDSGHADEVGAEGAEGADLGGRLVGWTKDGEVDAFGKADVLARSFGLGEGSEGR